MAKEMTLKRIACSGGLQYTVDSNLTVDTVVERKTTVKNIN